MTWRVAFTGHRPDKLGGYGESELGREVKQALHTALAERLAKYGTELVAMSGMALGVDQWAAEACVELGIPFIAAIPCWGQDSKWPRASKLVYERLLWKAKDSICVTQNTYTPSCMRDRNRYMVDWCDELLAVWDGSSGGTEWCIRYAHGKAKPVKNVHPRWRQSAG